MGSKGYTIPRADAPVKEADCKLIVYLKPVVLHRLRVAAGTCLLTSRPFEKHNETGRLYLLGID